MFGSKRKRQKTVLNRSDKRKGKKPWRKFFLQLCLLGVVIAIIGVIAGLIGYKVVTDPYKRWAEEFNIEEEELNRLELPSIIYDRKGREIGRFYVQNRSYVSIDKIPKTMINALVAQEDSRFFSHHGVDYIGVARAAIGNAKSGGTESGASTITQQLARNAYDLKERADERNESGVGRKMVEIFLAKRIEQKYSKEQILEFYLNRVYLGSGFYGIRSASLGYFGKEPQDLTDREAASIAGLIKGPNSTSPLNDPEANLKWRNHVLGRMQAEGYITAEANARLREMPLGLNPKPLRRGVSHFYEKLANQVSDIIGEEQMSAGGHRIYTTLDLEIQKSAEQRLRKELSAIEARENYAHPLYRDYKAGSDDDPKYLEGSVLMIDNETGGILAYVAGRDFTKRQFDAITARRPVGTAYLPVVYAAAMESNLNPQSRVLDEAVDNRMVGIGGNEGILAEWGPESFDNKYEGEISARRAFSQSKIGATIRLGRKIGMNRVLETHRRLKLPDPQASEKGTYLPRVLVGFDEASLEEMVRAYSSFGGGGVMPDELHFLQKITDVDGKTIFVQQAQMIDDGDTTLDSATAFQVQSLMKEALKKGTGKEGAKKLSKAYNGGGKTGTTNEFSDLWFLGGNQKITCGVWMGMLEGRQAIYQGAFSHEHAQPVWTDAINSAMRNFSTPPRKVPASLQPVKICSVSGLQGTRYCYEPTPEGEENAGRLRPSTFTEYLRHDQLHGLGVCDKHGPGEAWATDLRIVAPEGNDGRSRILPLPAIPVRAPVLIGDDPYKSEGLVNTPRTPDFYSGIGQASGGVSRPVVISAPAELGDADARIRLPRPPRLKVELELE